MHRETDNSVVIFGAGNFGNQALYYYGSDNVIGFIDNDEKKWGKELHGKKIFSLVEFLKDSPETEIVVATNAYSQITKQLKQNGVSNYKIFLPQYMETQHEIDELLSGNPKAIAILGAEDSTIAVIQDVEDKVSGNTRLIVCEKTGNELIGSSFENYEVAEFESIKDSIDAVIIGAQSRAYSLSAYVMRSFGVHKPNANGVMEKPKIKVINPFIQKGYYSSSQLVFSPYGGAEKDITENEWNTGIERNPDMLALNAYVDELNEGTPLFEHVEIETINRCNGKCSFCPVSAGNDIRERQVMDESLFYSIIDQLSRLNYSGRLATFSNNEPFLDSRIIDFNRYARNKLPKARIHLFTNGSLLSLDKFIEIIKYLDELIIDNYNQNLELNPNSRIIHDYCKDYPELINKVTIVLRKEQEILTSRGGDAPNRKNICSFPDIKCALPYKQLIIRPDGKVSLCCNDPYGRTTLGDVSKETLVDIWYGDSFQNVRKKLCQGRGNYEHCKNCDTFILY